MSLPIDTQIQSVPNHEISALAFSKSAINLKNCGGPTPNEPTSTTDPGISQGCPTRKISTESLKAIVAPPSYQADVHLWSVRSVRVHAPILLTSFRKFLLYIVLYCR